MTNHREEVNRKIKNYWLEHKKKYVLSKLKKSKVPSFTRINCSALLRLSRAWRVPRGRHPQKVLHPNIGYKRPYAVRFYRKVDGLLITTISSVAELKPDLREKEVYQIASSVGARGRTKILERAKELQLPLYIP